MKGGLVENRAGMVPRPSEIFLAGIAKSLPVGVGKHRIGVFLPGVKAGQLFGQPTDLMDQRGLSENQGGQGPALVQLIHFHRIFDDVLPFPESVSAAAIADGNHTAIDSGREPSIEINLSSTVIQAFFQGGKIEKSQIHRFLDFIDLLSVRNTLDIWVSRTSIS